MVVWLWPPLHGEIAIGAERLPDASSLLSCLKLDSLMKSLLIHLRWWPVLQFKKLGNLLLKIRIALLERRALYLERRIVLLRGGQIFGVVSHNGYGVVMPTDPSSPTAGKETHE